jgi:DNA-directed RNA polymerase subunit beta'
MTEYLYALFQKPKNPKDFDAIRIKLASPERIREWSYGEVKKPEAINYRTFKPEHDGLFCAKIFGPVKDWECLCGKYKRIKHRGVICDKCGVEVIQSKVRRERMGHIELATPVAHVWFLRGVPSRIGTLLDMTIRQLEKVLYFEEYIVIDPGDTPLKEKELLSEDEYKKKLSELGSRFKAGMGAEAIRELLKKVDLETLAKELKGKVDAVSSLGVKRKLTKRLKIVEAFIKSENRPEWMILDIVPVLPPDLRPLVPLDGGLFATSDLNDLYRRVINRNNRLKRLMELKAPSVIIKNEKRMLQETVDALFDKSKKAKVLKAGGKRALKSLSDMIKGTQGRFRQNLLGKRVDYSGRSVIVVDPELKLNQCGLPQKMALELFKPFVFNKLEEKGYATTIKQAKRLVEKETPEVWDALEDVIHEHPVLLNRQPTLHKYSIQAFDPVLVEGLAIRLHPLVCKAFNADFDGDQMAVYVPLSIESQIEARVLMSPVNNILSSANGEPVIIPSQDIVFGIYYLTKESPEAQQNMMLFADPEDVRIAYDNKVIDEHTKIKVRIDGKLTETTTGRVLFREILPCGFPFDMVNKTLRNTEIQSIIKYIYKEFGEQDTVIFLNRLMTLGFEQATKSGLSICADDIIITTDMKVPIIKDVIRKELEIFRIMSAENENEDDREPPSSEKLKQTIIELWEKAFTLIYEEVKKEYEKTNHSLNSIYMMIDSGARGNWMQLFKIAGLQGLIYHGKGNKSAKAITSSYKEGLSPMELYETAIKMHRRLALNQKIMQQIGWLMRKLVTVAQPLVIIEEDCGTIDGIYLEDLKLNDKTIFAFEERAISRLSAETVFHPETNELLLHKNEEITETILEKLTKAGLKRVKVRSPITCDCRNGICAKCYGIDLSTEQIVSLGEAIGIIAAQSLTAPLWQLIFDKNRDNNVTYLNRLIELFEARLSKDSEIVATAGKNGLQKHLIDEIQKVYRLKGISINDKHIEVIVRQMMRKVRIEDPGDTTFVIGDEVDKITFVWENELVKFEGGRPACGIPLLQGITKASLSSESWISASAFQETVRVLTNAATIGKIDELKGLNENIILGRIIPAGSGYPQYKKTLIKGEFFKMAHGQETQYLDCHPMNKNESDS